MRCMAFFCAAFICMAFCSEDSCSGGAKSATFKRPRGDLCSFFRRIPLFRSPLAAFCAEDSWIVLVFVGPKPWDLNSPNCALCPTFAWTSVGKNGQVLVDASKRAGLLSGGPNVLLP